MPSRQLVETDFPIYCVITTKQNHVILGGGGGQSKTGVPNCMQVHDMNTGAKLLSRISTGIHAVSNLGLSQNGKALVAGLDGLGRIYNLTPFSKTFEDDEKIKEITKEEEEQEQEGPVKYFAPKGEMKTDFGPEGGYQKVVRFGSNEMFATGGSDGSIRIWSYPDFSETMEIKSLPGEEQEVQKLDFDPSGRLIACVYRKGKVVRVNSTKTGKEEAALVFGFKRLFYSFNSIRFATIDGEVYVIALASLPRMQSYIVMWDAKTWKVSKFALADKHPSTVMDVSSCGKYIAVGTSEGDVIIYDSKTIKRIHTAKEVHDIFITDLAFTQNSAGVISTSVDKRCVYTDVLVTEGGYGNIVWIIAVIVVVIAYLYMNPEILDKLGHVLNNHIIKFTPKTRHGVDGVHKIVT
eukprot:CFRG3776T1